MNKITRFLSLCCAVAVLAGISGAGVLSARASTDNGQTAETTAETVAETTEAPVKPAPTEFAHIYECAISGDQIVIDGQMEGSFSDSAYYDNYLYLFEQKPYQRDLKGRTDYAAWITKGDALHFSIPLNHGTQSDRLYSSFVVAVYDGEEYIKVSNEVYVTNPEVMAKYTEPYKTGQTKKGLLIQTTQSMIADAFELGVNHVIVNIPFSHILGSGIDYTYDGRTYHFSSDVLAVYDDTIRRMSEKNMTVTAVLLNDWNNATPQLYYPGVTRQPAGTANYYGFHVATEEGFETLKAIAAFLTERYSSLQSPYGRVSNWVIGNEINNQLWNYMGPMSLEQYMEEYVRAFRVFYTAIRSTSSTSRVFFSTDYNWLHEADGRLKYNAKDVLDTFNSMVVPGGPMDWELAYHPYSIPMVEPEFWNDAETGLIKNNASSPVVNMINLNVLTDYLQQPQFLMRSGKPRHVILSEQGFTSQSHSRGEVEELQAAAIAYAYYLADSNPLIDAFIMSRQVDAPSEVAASCSFGLWSCDMSKPNDIVPTMRKQSWTVYKNIDDRKRTLETTEKYKKYIGIEKWSDVIPDFKWKSQEK